MKPRIREAVLSDAAALGALYAEAFATNARYRHVFQCADEASHAHALTWLFQRRVVMALRGGCPFLVSECEQPAVQEGASPTRRLLAAAALVPHSRKAGPLDWLACGLATWPFLHGIASMMRALALYADSPPCAGGDEGEVVMVAVRTDSQGRGVGSGVVRELLSQWDSRGGGAAVLSTQSERNVTFYQRLGFTLDCVPTGAKPGPYENFTLRREKRALAPCGADQGRDESGQGPSRGA